MTRCSVSRSQCRILAIAGVLVALGGGCGSAAATEQSDAAASLVGSPALDRLSNQGKAYQSLLPGDKRVLDRMAQHGRKVRVISILATRGDRAFYRVDSECYATGPASPTTQSFTSIGCSPDFPSADQPILDFTIFGGVGGNDQSPPTTLTIQRSDGLAADGVVKVAFLDAGDQVVAETPVTDNTYRFDPVPAGDDLRLVAYSKTGERVFEQPKRAAPAATP